VRRVFAIAFKDLRSTSRNLPALAMMLAAPLALSALLGFAFGGGGGFSVSATKVAVVNLDRPTAQGSQTPAAGASIVDILKSSGLKDILTTTEKPTAAAARASVDDGKDVVAVIIPQNLSSALYGPGGAGISQAAAVELYQNPTEGIGDAIVQSVVGQSLLTFNAARAAAVAAQQVATANGDAQGADAAAQKAAQAYVQNAQGGSHALAVVSRAPNLSGGRASRQIGIIGLVLAGMMVFFMFFGASNVARTILTEERDGTLPRLFTTPSSKPAILGGKFASTFLTVLVQAVIIIVCGRLFFGIDWGALDAVALLILAAAAVASSLGLLVISLVRTPAQAGAIGAGVYLVLALLGGNFTGSAQSGTTYATVQRFTPNGWLLVGWNETLRGGGLGDILWPVLVPLACAAAFFAIAVLRFRKRFA
jgi:ABC-2 type transport system permease protein